MIPAAILAAALAVPAAAAVYVPEPVRLYDGLTGRVMTLADMGDEGLDPDAYVTPWKGNGPVPSFTSLPPQRVPLPCGWAEYMLPEHRIFCGSPAGASTRSAQRPSPHTPPGDGRVNPVPLPAGLWLILAGVGALVARSVL